MRGGRGLSEKRVCRLGRAPASTDRLVSVLFPPPSLTPSADLSVTVRGQSGPPIPETSSMGMLPSHLASAWDTGPHSVSLVFF